VLSFAKVNYSQQNGVEKFEKQSTSTQRNKVQVKKSARYTEKRSTRAQKNGVEIHRILEYYM
jgi:hypothetical protein